jgi:hypothetical protein
MKSFVESTSADQSFRATVATQRMQSPNRSASEMSLVEAADQVLGNISFK